MQSLTNDIRRFPLTFMMAFVWHNKIVGHVDEKGFHLDFINDDITSCTESYDMIVLMERDVVHSKLWCLHQDRTSHCNSC